MSRLVPYLIRGDKTTGNVDLSKEATLIAPASVTTVECWKIAYKKCRIGIQNQRKITNYANQGAIAIDLKKVVHTVVFSDIWVGDIDSETAAYYLLENLEYICTEWKSYGACTLAWYDLDTSAFVNKLRMYKSAYQNRVVAPPKQSDIELDQFMNGMIPQIVLDEVVTLS